MRESIDLRLSEVFKNDSQVIMEVQDGDFSDAINIFRPQRKESSPIILLEESVENQPPQIQLRSCFKGERAKKNMKVHKITMQSHTIFNERLANDESLDYEIRERIEHNLVYNDDTIFDGLSIF